MSRPPLGIVLVAMLTAVYGLMWSVVFLISLRGDAPLWLAVSFPVALGVFAIAYALYQLHPIGWVLAVLLYLVGITWTGYELSQGEPRLVGLLVGVVIVLYLVAVRNEFITDERADQRTPG